MSADETGPLVEVIRTMVRIVESPLADREKLERLRMQLGAAVVLVEKLEGAAEMSLSSAAPNAPHWRGQLTPRR